MNRAYISYGTLWNPEPISPLRLKLVTLLFDRVVFQHVYRSDLVSEILRVYCPGESVPQAACSVLGACWSGAADSAPRFSIYGVNDQWPWDSASSTLRNTTGTVIQELLGTADPSTEENYELYKYGGYLMSDILHWRAYFKDATLVADNVAESIVERLNLFPEDDTCGYSSISTSIPNLLDVPWATVTDLRDSPFLKNFRKKYAQLTLTGETTQLFDEYLEALERLSDAVRPSTTVEVAKAVLGNLPIPMVNPISIASGVKDIWKSEQLKREYGWLFFLRELRSNSEKSFSDEPKPIAD